MKNYFCNKKFRALLLTGSVTTVIQYLLILSDTVVIGNILGQEELAAVNVVKPFHSAAIFLASLISIGTSVFYSLEIGKFNKNRANALFGQGVILSLFSGVVLFLLALSERTLIFHTLICRKQQRSGLRIIICFISLCFCSFLFIRCFWSLYIPMETALSAIFQA